MRTFTKCTFTECNVDCTYFGCFVSSKKIVYRYKEALLKGNQVAAVGDETSRVYAVFLHLCRSTQCAFDQVWQRLWFQMPSSILCPTTLNRSRCLNSWRVLTSVCADTVRLAFSEVAPSPNCSSLNANFAQCKFITTTRGSGIFAEFRKSLKCFAGLHKGTRVLLSLSKFAECE